MELVKCKLCDNKYKQITYLHLQAKHNMTLKEYEDKFPEANMIPPYDCVNCGEEVDDKKSLKAKYCEECKYVINKENVLKAVRKYNKKKKHLILKAILNAYGDYGIATDKTYMDMGDVRIDNEHAHWNYIPNLRDEKGTFNEANLEVNEKTGRIREMERLEYLKRKMKYRNSFTN